MLVQRKCDLADVDGLGTYVSANNNGVSLHANFGFVDYSKASQETTLNRLSIARGAVEKCWTYIQ